MKQRIIGLILVVTMAFLALTGCGFNYAKKDMAKYTDFNAEAFANALQSLSIKEGDFGTKEADRLVKVQDAISAALLQIADTNDKLYAGKPQKDDAFYFCYYAMDDEGNIFFISKNMDAAKPTSIQLGLSTLEGLNKAISDAVLAGEGIDITSHIYDISTTTNTVGEGDIISLTYTKGETTTTREYVDLGKDDKNDLESALVGAKVGVVIDELKVGEETYTDVKVESVLNDKSDLKTKKDDMVFISYTRVCDVSSVEGYTKPEDAPGTYDADKKKYTETVTYYTAQVGEDAEGEKTFLGQLRDQKPGSVSNITVKEDDVPGANGATVDVTYEKITIHWIVDKVGAPIEVKYTPYDEELKEDKSNAKKEKDVFGNEHTLNQVELTYGVFPVYYLDVETLSADVIVREFYTALNTTQTKEHDHTEEDHEHETEYVFATLNDEGYVKDGKTIAALVGELVKLYETHASNEKSLDSATTNLNNAQSKLAKDDGKSVTTTTNLEKSVTDTTKAFNTAKDAAANSQKEVDAKIAEILACKKGEDGVSSVLVTDYNDYQYKTLEDKYKADLNSKLADAIYSVAKANVSYKQLPKSAVKQAYKAIMNTYKNTFYEGQFSTGTGSSTSTSTSTESNYSHYEGNFDKFLIAKLTSEKKITENSIEAAEKALWAEAEQTVKDILLIYVLVDYFGEDTVGLTNKEKKDLKKELEQLSKIYQQYGLAYSYNLDDYVHAAQFDKIFNHLLEEGTPVDDPNNADDQNVVVYENIKYTTTSASK